MSDDLVGLVERLRIHGSPINLEAADALEMLNKRFAMEVQYKLDLHSALTRLRHNHGNLKEDMKTIVRLRAENEKLMKAYPFHVWRKEKDALKAEIERLRDEKATVTRIMNERNQTVIRLREALEKIADADIAEHADGYVKEFARAALKHDGGQRE